MANLENRSDIQNKYVASFICFLVCGLASANNTIAQQTAIGPKISSSDSPYFLESQVAALIHPSGIRGSASCAASSCHGGPKPSVSKAVAIRGSEYSLWKESDPHSQSWRTLNSEASLSILKKLKILQNNSIVNVEAFQNCLACHNTDRSIATPDAVPSIAEGVGCEMCHGPSEKWYDRHFDGKKSRHPNLTNLESLITRAKACTLCHVGAKDRDMNHEIIAAGHPALYFDFAVYHEKYPKHWRENGQGSADMRARLWLAGQIAAADAELELVEARTRNSHTVSTWPELAQYRCTDCHLSLSGIPRNPSSTDLDRITSGSADVRCWNVDGISALSHFRSKSPDDKLGSQLLKFKGAVKHSSMDVEAIQSATKLLRSALNDELKHSSDESLIQWDSRRQLQYGGQLADSSNINSQWETASAFYTAVWAGLPGSKSSELKGALSTMQRALTFAPSLQSPQFPRKKFSQSPPDFEQWQSSLETAKKLLKAEDLSK